MTGTAVSLTREQLLDQIRRVLAAGAPSRKPQPAAPAVQAKDSTSSWPAADTSASSFAVMSFMAASASGVMVATSRVIAETNNYYHTDLPNPVNHGVATVVNNSQATQVCGGLAFFGFAMAGAHSSAALREYLLKDKDRDHVSALVNGVQYSSSVFFFAAMLSGASTLMAGMPYVLAALVAVNVLYQLGKCVKNFSDAYDAKGAERQRLIKEGFANFALLLVNVLVMASFVLFFYPLFMAAKSGNASAVLAVFKNPVEALMASAFATAAVAMVTKICLDACAWFKNVWKDPSQALSKLWREETALFCGQKSNYRNKIAGALLVAGRILPVLLKSLLLWAMKGLQKIAALRKTEKTCVAKHPGLFAQPRSTAKPLPPTCKDSPAGLLSAAASPVVH